MEYVLDSIVRHIVTHGPQQRQVPLRGTVSKFVQVNPEVALAVSNDVADVQVAMHAAGRVWHRLQELQGTLLVILRHAVLLTFQSLHTNYKCKSTNFRTKFSTFAVVFNMFYEEDFVPAWILC